MDIMFLDSVRGQLDLPQYNDNFPISIVTDKILEIDWLKVPVQLKSHSLQGIYETIDQCKLYWELSHDKRFGSMKVYDVVNDEIFFYFKYNGCMKKTKQQ